MPHKFTKIFKVFNIEHKEDDHPVNKIFDDVHFFKESDVEKLKEEIHLLTPKKIIMFDLLKATFRPDFAGLTSLDGNMCIANLFLDSDK